MKFFLILELDHNERVKTKKDWMRGKVVILVVTHDLGVGLNKFGVGCVIHWSLPLTMEQYYRDIGRAGRFGGKALSRIYLGVEDWMNAQYLMMGKSSHLFSSFENVLQFCIADAYVVLFLFMNILNITLKTNRDKSRWCRYLNFQC